MSLDPALIPQTDGLTDEQRNMISLALMTGGGGPGGAGVQGAFEPPGFMANQNPLVDYTTGLPVGGEGNKPFEPAGHYLNQNPYVDTGGGNQPFEPAGDTGIRHGGFEPAGIMVNQNPHVETVADTGVRDFQFPPTGSVETVADTGVRDFQFPPTGSVETVADTGVRGGGGLGK